MVELTTRTFIDFGLPRRKSVFLCFILTVALGAPSALMLGFFENQDWAWGLGLMLSGFFMALAVLRFGVDRFRRLLINGEGSDLKVGRWFNVVVGVLIPIQFISLMIWWGIKSVGWEPDWWNPFARFSISTCILQWGAAIVIFLLLNRYLARTARRKEENGG